MRKNEKQTDDPVGSEEDPKVSEMGKPSEVEARVWRDMAGWGANHDTLLVELGAELVILLPKGTNFVLELQELLLAPIT